MLVKILVKQSPIHGYGVFAAQDVKKGTRMWQYTEGADTRHTAAEIDLMPHRFRSWVYKNRLGDWILCQDGAKFMNHAVQPCCDDVSDPIYTLAARDIQEGEEITCDYTTFYCD